MRYLINYKKFTLFFEILFFSANIIDFSEIRNEYGSLNANQTTSSKKFTLVNVCNLNKRKHKAINQITTQKYICSDLFFIV